MLLPSKWPSGHPRRSESGPGPVPENERVKHMVGARGREVKRSDSGARPCGQLPVKNGLADPSCPHRSRSRFGVPFLALAASPLGNPLLPLDRVSQAQEPGPATRICGRADPSCPRRSKSRFGIPHLGSLTSPSRYQQQTTNRRGEYHIIDVHF